MTRKLGQGRQATQVVVAGSHSLPVAQVADRQLLPGLALATHVMPLQVPVAQVPNSRDPPGSGAHGRPIPPAGTQTPALHAAQGTQLEAASAQLCPGARRTSQLPARQNSVPGQSVSAWHGPPAPRG